MEQRRPNKEFGKRGPIAPQPAAPPKRSSHVALLLMGTFAIGGSAYALMPRQNCQPSSPEMAAPAASQTGTECSQRGTSSGGGHGYSSHSYFFGSDSTSSHAASGGSSDAGLGGVTRGGFGSFAHAMPAHFSGGG